MADIANPHDRFFKAFMSRPDAARDFLERYLPPKVAALLDASSVELMPGSFVDPELREHHSDLLYSVKLKTGAGAHVYVLFEHSAAAGRSRRQGLRPRCLRRASSKIVDRHAKRIVFPTLQVELYAAPAEPPHATQHFGLTYVLGAHVRAGYRGAVDLLTHAAEASDFAPDASIFPAEPDPKTGGRKLEEIAFEVTDRQALSVPTGKARELVARGVRRVFCIMVRPKRMLEWSRCTDGWETLPEDASIEDLVLVSPLPIRALLHAAEADDAVARALLAKHVPAIEQALAEREARGEAREPISLPSFASGASS